ncbi:MAG TPA: copper resistance protein CopC [Actinomycetota bacterium]|nr:copper resistance protein CopC [Actinomycetota bacterium]
MRSRHVLALAILGATASVPWLAGSATTASAHAALERSAPDDGAILEDAPAAITLSFTEPTDLSLTTVTVASSAGGEVATSAPEHGAIPRVVTVAIEDELPEGVYTVAWRTVSTTDTHLTAGSFSFGVGVETGAVPTGPDPGSDTTPTPSVLSVVGRWSLYVGLVVLLGAAAAGLLATGPTTVARPPVLGVAWLLTAVGVIALTLAERTAVGVPLGTLLSSDAGSAYVRLAVAVVVAGAAVLAAAVRTSRVTLAFLAATAIAAALARAEGGHAGGSILGVLVQTLHVVGVSAWIGGLVWLGLGLRRGLDERVVRRFSNLAAVGLGILVLTGVLRASDELGFSWWLDPFASGYTTALSIKILAFVPLVGLGAINRYRNVPRYAREGTRPLLRSVGAELAIAAVILGVTGTLTGLAPSGSERPGRERTQAMVVTGSDFATTTTVRLQIDPGRVGPNAFVASVSDYDTGEPVEARSVSLRFTFPDRPDVGSTLPLERAGDGWRAQSTALSLFGPWEVTALVGSRSSAVEVPLVVVPRPPDQRVEVSRSDGQPDLYTIPAGGGAELQLYVDPGTGGRTNQVHVTAFDASGAELPLRDATVWAVGPVGEVLEPEVIRFGPGHFVANVELDAGGWTFATSAEAEDGRTVSAVIEQDLT